MLRARSIESGLERSSVAQNRPVASVLARVTRLSAVLVLASSSTLSHADVLAVYDFNYVPSQSGLTATIDSGIDASGTLIGNYNVDTNPTGTRTKPGLFGSFGETENLPVDVNTLGAGFNGNLNTDTTGGFRMSFDSVAGTVGLTDLAANFLGNGPANLPLTISLSTQSFRTRNPTFLYPGVPIELPIGNASLTTFSLLQDGPSVGTMTQTGPNTYDFTVAALVNVTLSASVLGQNIDLPGILPLPFGFAGSVVFDGNNAQITSATPIDFSQTQDPGQALPEFALPLPTLDPDAPANVLLNLTLSQIGAEIAGDLQTTANGVLVPTPGALGLGALSGIMLARRRRSQ
jgi:hypothetical protein